MRFTRADLASGAGTSGTPYDRAPGAATYALSTVLPWCADRGIDRVLVTCGGVYEDTRHGTLRYWVPTAP